MKYISRIQKSFIKQINAHYKVTALDTSVAKDLAEQLHKLPKEKQQEALETFVNDKGLMGDDLSELMYDLNKEGIKTLVKPTPTPHKLSSPNPLIARLLSGPIDKQFGTMLIDAQETDYDYDEFELYLVKNPDKWGKFIDQASKNEIGFYENNLGNPIPKEALQHVSDEYIINELLFQSVYGFKGVTKDGIKYLFDKYPNPFKILLSKQTYMGFDEQNIQEMFDRAATHFTTTDERKKMKKWFDELDKDVQKGIMDNVTDIKKYLNV